MKRVVTAVLIGVLIKKIIVKIANKTVQLKIDFFNKKVPVSCKYKKTQPSFSKCAHVDLPSQQSTKIVSTIG